MGRDERWLEEGFAWAAACTLRNDDPVSASLLTRWAVAWDKAPVGDSGRLVRPEIERVHRLCTTRAFSVVLSSKSMQSEHGKTGSQRPGLLTTQRKGGT